MEPAASAGGSANVEATLSSAGQTASVGIDSGASLAAALTTSSRQFALPSTPMVSTPVNVERLDQLFAAGLDEGTNSLLQRARRHLLSFDDA